MDLTPAGAPEPADEGPGGSGAGPSAERVDRTDLRLALALAGGLALLGVPVGLLWAALAPRALARPAPDGGVAPVDTQTQAFIAADGLLFLLGLAAGVLTGWLCWRRARRAPLEALLGMALGATLAVCAAWQVGVLTDDRDAVRAALREPGRTAPVELPLRLRSLAALLGWPAGAVLTFTVSALRAPEMRSDARLVLRAGPPRAVDEPAEDVPGR